MMNPVKINVGRVRSAMAAKGLGLKTAAEKAEITYGTFSRILTEGRCTSIMLGRIARALGVPVWELVDK